MAPYRNVRYWLSDFRSGGKAIGREEIFNLCHVRLRNVIEHVFSIVKVHFPILKRMTPYSFATQTKIVMTLSPFTIFFDKSQLLIDCFLNMTLKKNWKVIVTTKIKSQLQITFLRLHINS